ncbi:GTP 3',8-cyclase MoaA [Treponema sp. C6A8]|uniref:GTP 3',8-cyclase MoaA n=1 Tax=Treponema sp. C6A8 TaxID=1410609 RepID=UPI00068505A5|nr:GTP 3',8-cyclase MoaA [Treponema sp. C6A8]
MESLTDSFGRTINYLRISLTDKCNLRCRYCMPPQGINHIPHQEILTFEEITELVRVLAGLGVKKIRLTGGEPLVRRDIVSLVKLLKDIPGIEEICLTTNGILFSELATDLKAAGLSRVNISLDTLNDDTFFAITGSRGVEKVLQSLKTALDLGFPVKINCVPSQYNASELAEITLLAKSNPIDLRFIELMPIGCANGMKGLKSDFILSELEEKFGKAAPLKRQNHSPETLYHFDGFDGNIGFISPLSHAFCSDCNRIRLTASGLLKFCLCYDDALDVKKLLRSGESGIKLYDILSKEIQKAIKEKPEAHTFNQQGLKSHMMTEIGG